MSVGRALPGTIAVRALMLPKVLENHETRCNPVLAATQAGHAIAQSMQDARPDLCTSPLVHCFHPMFGDHMTAVREIPVQTMFARRCLQVVPRMKQLACEQRQWFMQKNCQTLREARRQTEAVRIELGGALGLP